MQWDLNALLEHIVNFANLGKWNPMLISGFIVMLLIRLIRLPELQKYSAFKWPDNPVIAWGFVGSTAVFIVTIVGMFTGLPLLQAFTQALPIFLQVSGVSIAAHKVTQAIGTAAATQTNTTPQEDASKIVRTASGLIFGNPMNLNKFDN